MTAGRGCPHHLDQRRVDDVVSVRISDEILAGRGEDVQIRLPTATESAVPPYVTILAAGAANSLKPTRCSTVLDLCPCLPQRPQRHTAHIGASGGGGESSWKYTALLPLS